MTDTKLQNLFDQDKESLLSEQSIRDDGFSDAVMMQLNQADQRRSLWKMVTLAAIALIAVTATIQLGVTEVVTLSLTSPLISLGEGWVSWILSPINNTGALLVLLVKFIHRISGGRSEWRGNLLPF